MKRSPISATQNIWFDAQQVDDSDLTLEQDYNNTIDSSIINNHIGSGVIPETLNQNIIFDSALFTGFLDGIAVSAQNQPTDNNFGNQLEIELINSKVADKRLVKVCIIGLDFQSNLQYETFLFKLNEIQVTKKHFTKVLMFLFNDFIGTPDLSFNLGGRIIIKEVNPITLSRDPIMVSQDVEPNIFFRDFFVDSITSGAYSLYELLQINLPTYNISSLNIFTTTSLDHKQLYEGDVVTQIGQKFLATTNNIQKITLLLSVESTDDNSIYNFDWAGDLVLSIYPLQSNVSSTDIAPNLQIDFAPQNIPLIQISYNKTTLENAGVILNEIPQPVDFILSNSPIASGNGAIVLGNYYAFTLKRAGTVDNCNINIEIGVNRATNSRETAFGGNLWVDFPEETLWFRIYTDAAKVSDGQMYDTGHGIILEKITVDDISQSTIDYCFDKIQFVGNDIFSAVISATTEETVPIPDQRTGEPVLSRKQFIPEVSLLNTIDLSNLKKVTDPLITGVISDKNRKYTSNTLISSNIHSATIVNNEILIKIIEQGNSRYDSTVNELKSHLLSGDFIGSKFIPNINNQSIFYRIAEAKLYSMILGDVNGDGIIDSTDEALLNSYVGYNLGTALPLNSSIAPSIPGLVGSHTTFVNGYNTYIRPFKNETGVVFQLVNKFTNVVAYGGTDGVLVADPLNNRTAVFSSASSDFNSLIGADSFRLVIFSLDNENFGGFDIFLNSASNTLTVIKVFLDSEAMFQLLRADVNCDLVIANDDSLLLHNYISRLPGLLTNIGKRFEVIKFKLETFVDRNDEYYTSINRSAEIHQVPDIFISESFAEHDFISPIPFSVQKQLIWEDSLIVTNNKPRLVQSIFTNENNFIENCNVEISKQISYEEKPELLQDKNDLFIPNNLIIGENGQIVKPNGDYYKVDFEISTITLEVPNSLFNIEQTINIFDYFVANYEDSGKTIFDYPAMKFSDCSFVERNDLIKNRVRFSAAIQSFADTNQTVGVTIDESLGILRLNYQQRAVRVPPIPLIGYTKIQIDVFLKKSGFNNVPVFIDYVKVENIAFGLNVNNPPTIISINPTSILSTDYTPISITITGSGFILSSQVKVDGTNVITNYIDASHLSISVRAYGIMESHVITVVNFGHLISNTATLAVVYPQPYISSIFPISKYTIDPPNSLDVVGTGFIDGSAVQVDLSSISTSFINQQHLTAVLPQYGVPGPLSVTVSNFGIISNTKIFTMLAPNELPVIGSVIPDNILWSDILLGSVILNVYGDGFNDLTTVWIASNPFVQFTNFVVVNEGHLQLTFTPSNCSPAVHTIYVYNPPPGGGNSDQFTFTITPVPHINTTTPLYKLTTDGISTITINGTGFIESSVIRVNGGEIVSTYVNPTTLTFDSSIIAVAGHYTITVFNYGAPLSNEYILDTWDSSQTPHLSSINPISVNCGLFDYAQIHVYGTGFIPTSQGMWAGYQMLTTFINDTEIIVRRYVSIDYGASLITVNNPLPGMGVSDNSKLFTIATAFPTPTVTEIHDHPTNPLLRVIHGTGFQQAWNVSSPVTWFLNNGNWFMYIGDDDYISDTEFNWNISGMSYGQYNVSVRNDCGGTWGGNYPYTLQEPPNPVPNITSTTPPSLSCPLNPDGYALEVNGEGFVYNATVEIFATVNGQQYNLGINSIYYSGINKLIVYFIYPIHYSAYVNGSLHYPLVFGNYTVRVTNPPNSHGQGGGNDTQTFTFNRDTPGAPTLLNINPSSGGYGRPRILTGTNFTSSSLVFIKTTSDTSDPNNQSYMGCVFNDVVFNNSTQITLSDMMNCGMYPAPGTNYLICVYTPCGGITQWMQHTITQDY